MGGSCNVPRTAHVVADRLHRVVLHHRHMLVGSCMEYHLRQEAVEQGVNPLLLAYIGNDRNNPQLRELSSQLLFNMIERRLGTIQQHKLGWMVTADLTADLAADTAGSTSHQHTFSRQIAADGLLIQLDRIASQKILDLHLLDL